MPTTTTGVATEFIQFTRASNATVTDSDGKIKWAPHNLLLASESFDAASWVKSFLSVAANSTTAPNGTTTADKLYPTSSSGRLYQTVTVPEYSVLSFYAKAAEMTALNVRDPANNSIAIVYVDLNTGAVSGSAAANASAVPAEDDWWFITWATAGVAYANVSIAPCNAVGSTASTPSGTNGVYLWGAALYRSDLGGMQPNTSAYPMYNPTTPKNLLGYTEDFSNWAKTVAGDTITLNAATAPNGLQTADLWVADGTSANHRLDQTVSVQPTTGTYSFYAKLQTASAFIQISQSGNNAGWVNFDLVNGTKSDQGTGITGSITSVGNGWYRCSAYNTNSPSANLRLSLVTGLSATRIETAAISSGIYLWGAQLSDSASLDAYSPVYGAAVTSAAYYGPRRDFDGATLACKGLLVEEQRTNIIVGSANFSGGGIGWVLDGASLITSATAGPDGSLSATSIVQGTGNNRTYQFDNSSVTGSKVFSIYVKPNAGSSLSISAIGGMSPNGPAVINATTGAVTGFTGASSVAVGNGWYRVFLPVTVTVASGSGTYWLISGPASSVFIWGAQLEAGSFATSYIPTGAATATRTADVASVSTQAFPYSATEGTIVVNASSPCIAAIANMITLDNGTTQERIRLLTDVASVKTIVTESNTTQANLSPGSATANTPFKFAVAYKVNDFAAVVNGSAAATDAAGNVPVVNIARLGADSSGNYLNGHIRQITYLPRRISNTELQTRTA